MPQPVLFIPHGGGPLPLLGDSGHQILVEFLQHLASTLVAPSAICVISAHWEADVASITSAASPALIYDYYGFPPESYTITYPAPGSPPLAKKLFDKLSSHNIPARLDDKRGFDHGLFVPLKLLFPHANIPCIQLSLLNSLDPETHINIGKALRTLRQENVLFIGSGFSFHNLSAFFAPNNPLADEKNAAFEDWLIARCTNPDLSELERQQRLINWQNAPYARFCHPREEHLLPLHVCLGLSENPAKLLFDGKVLGKRSSGFLWQ